MPEIKITVRNKAATGDNTVLICDNSDYTVKFDLDAEWESLLTRTMRVSYYDKTYTDVVFTGNVAALPAIVGRSIIKIGLYAGNIHTSTPAIFNCEKSVVSDGGVPVAPTPSVYNQLLEAIDEKTMPSGGTTGQVLAKASNADYDFNWQSGGTATVTRSAIETALGTVSPNLSANDYTNAEKAAVTANTAARHGHDNKGVLDGITSVLVSAWSAAWTWISTHGASVISHLSDSVKHITASERSTWNAKSDFSGSYSDLTNKPNIPSKTSDLTNDSGFLTEHQSLAAYRTSSAQDVIDAGKQATISDLSAIRSGAALGSTAVQTETDPTVPSWAKASEKPSYTASEIGAIPATAKGANNGVAELDATGKIPSGQLPSYVDDVLEYANAASFPATGESGKIYIAIDTNTTYRWGGSVYVEIGSSLALGETSSTAYRGDRGKTAYDHSQDASVHVTSEQKSAWSAKQDAISDLSTIRSGAAAGATALQSVPSTYRTAAEQDAIHDATKQDAISDLSTIRSGAALGATALQSVKTINSQSITGSGNLDVPMGGDIIQDEDESNCGIVVSGTLATVDATLSVSGDAADAAATGTAINDKYTKPASGIPASDIASGVIPSVSVSASGTATDEVNYITINGVEKKLAGGGSGTSDFDQLANRPKYNGSVITHETNIPEVKTAAWDAKSNFSGSYNDLSNKPSIPTKTSDLTNDSGFLTQHQSLAAYRTAEAQDAIHDATKQDVISDIATIRSGAALGATALQSVPNTYRTAEEQDAIHDSTKQNTSDKVTTISSSSTDAQYPSAKAVYDYILSLDGNGVSY